jgi:hypothetical protein
MMVGSRFSVGSEIPRSLPVELHREIRAVEASLSEEEMTTLRWTLTWLEGRPVVTLDNGVQVGRPAHESDED